MRVNGIEFTYRGECYREMDVPRGLEETSLRFDTETGSVSADLGSLLRMLYRLITRFE